MGKPLVHISILTKGGKFYLWLFQKLSVEFDFIFLLSSISQNLMHRISDYQFNNILFQCLDKKDK